MSIERVRKLNKERILVILGAIFFIEWGFIFIFTDFKKESPNSKNDLKSNIADVKYLANPPEIVKAIYLTSPSAGNEKKIDHIINLAKLGSINAVVIDIKDFSGHIGYDSDAPDPEKYGSERKDIEDINGLLRKLHQENIYVIGRITVFQDPILSKARPEWAVKNKYTNQTWHDKNGLAWINPAASSSWDYFVALARDANNRGFDELNFDYIRFPSDGDMTALIFPGLKKSKADTIGDFYHYLRKSLPGMKLSADMFGFVTTRNDDLGIGQLIENAFAVFDYIAPMVYPSHYPANYLGYSNPAVYPYEVVNVAMKGGLARLKAYKLAHPENKTQLRPWLQDFDLGADYTPEMIKAEIQAVQDVLGENYTGFMLWNARNVYTEAALR